MSESTATTGSGTHHHPTITTDGYHDMHHDMYYTPLLLSTVAGMSTCLGAAIVFCHPKTTTTTTKTKTRATNARDEQHQSESESVANAAAGTVSYVVSPSMMAFSLSLAASVMLTVSVVSIGPECLLDPFYEQQHAININTEGSSSSMSSSSKWLKPNSYLFLQRLFSFALGCGLYGLLRRLFPEPDVVETELLTSMYGGGRGDCGGGDGDLEIGIGDDCNNNNKTSASATDAEKSISIFRGSSSSSSQQLLRRRDSTAKLAGGVHDKSDVASSLLGNAAATTSTGDANGAETDIKDDDDGDEYEYDYEYMESDTNTVFNSGGKTQRERQRLVRRLAPPPPPGDGGDRPDPRLKEAQQRLGGVQRSQQQQQRQQHYPPSRAQSFQSWASGEDLDTKDQRRAWRVAMLLFVSLMVHNFPEGLAVSAAALEADKLGITVTIGIAIHNIPEGIAIAVPCLAARPDSPWISFALASFSGLAEPLGAFVSLLFLRGFGKTEKDSWLSLENVLAFVAGIMITVAVVELYPEAMRHATPSRKYVHIGSAVGVVVMVLTELVI